MTLWQYSQKRGFLCFMLSTWEGKWTNSKISKGYSSTFLRVAESASKDDWYRSPYRVAKFRNSSIECFICRDKITRQKHKAKQNKQIPTHPENHYTVTSNTKGMRWHIGEKFIKFLLFHSDKDYQSDRLLSIHLTDIFPAPTIPPWVKNKAKQRNSIDNLLLPLLISETALSFSDYPLVPSCRLHGFRSKPPQCSLRYQGSCQHSANRVAEWSSGIYILP